MSEQKETLYRTCLSIEFLRGLSDLGITEIEIGEDQFNLLMLGISSEVTPEQASYAWKSGFRPDVASILDDLSTRCGLRIKVSGRKFEEKL